MSEAIINEHIREYNFAIPGAIERHIPGIPGTWPFGSVVTVNDETKEVLSVQQPNDLKLTISGPTETIVLLGTDQHGTEVDVNITYPAVKPVQEQVGVLMSSSQQLLDAVKQS